MHCAVTFWDHDGVHANGLASSVSVESQEEPQACPGALWWQQRQQEDEEAEEAGGPHRCLKEEQQRRRDEVGASGALCNRPLIRPTPP